MIEILNNDRYITQETLEKCFKQGAYSYVDKVICGNGFSTAFINNKPPRNKVNIIIAPNRAVVTSKEESYRRNPTENRIKFFYKDSVDTDFMDAEVLMFVADSFLLMKDRLYWIKDRIHNVLIDEAHSVEIQSKFRSKLVDFTSEVRKIIGSEPALVSVTATPNLFTPVNIRIRNKIVTPMTINLTNDFQRSIERIRGLLDAGEKVVVATNNKNVIYRLRDANNVVEADFTIGEGLSRSLVELVIVKENKDSYLKVISSRGFEGFDIHGKDFNVVFFEDRNSIGGFESFYIANLYQAINRVRDGAKTIEYCRKELTNAKPTPFTDIDKDIKKFITRTDITINQKQSLSHDKKYYLNHPYLIFTQENSENSPNYGDFSVKANKEAIRLYKESLAYDKPFPSEEFTTFLKERKISINNICTVPKKLKVIRLAEEEKIDRLKTNEKFITGLDLFGDDFFITPQHREKVSEYFRDLATFVRRKNYTLERGISERESIALNLLSNPLEFNKVLVKFTKLFNERSIAKYGIKASKYHRDIFAKRSVFTLCKLAMLFSNDTITIPRKWTVNRDYNILTEIGVAEIKYIPGLFNVEVTEVDVNSAFIRVIYALNGLELPLDFYGKDKKNKLKINILLNSFFYDETKKSPLRLQKLRAIKSFQAYNFDEKVISYLIDNFFMNKDKGSLFHFLSFYEKKLVGMVKKIAIDEFETEGFGRRHDSLILFNNQSSLEKLNHLDFLNSKGWFKIVKEGMTREEEIAEFDEFMKTLD